MEVTNDNGCSWVNDLIPRTNIKSLQSNEDCEWLIVGAGYTGLSAARKLGQLYPNQKIILIDAQLAGEGASSRNSGYLVDTTLNDGFTSNKELDNYKKKADIYDLGINVVKKFISDIASKVENVEVMLEKRSDDENKILLLDAYFLVQRHSTLGLYAMSARIPIISYSSEFEHPFDEMYFFLNSKYHAKSLADLPNVIKKFNADLNDESMDEYLNEQSDNYALSNGNCFENISSIIHDYNDRSKNKV